MNTFVLRCVISTVLLSGATLSGEAAAQGLECALSEGNQKVVVGDFGSCGANAAVLGENTAVGGIGVQGVALDTSQRNWGVRGDAYGTNGIAVLGTSHSSTGYGYGMVGESVSEAGYGVAGFASKNTGVNYGMYAATWSPQGYGLYVINNGNNNSGFAAYFNGRVHVNGALSKSSGSFKIDHPTDPENRYLSHSFVESPDMMNVYNGNAVVGADGSAVVELPAYFEDLNAEYRYQLTAIGASAPDLYVAEEIKGNSFKIAGAKPGIKVSWQVTGVRNDMYARKNRIKVEEMKAEADRGKYLNPVAFGKPAEQGIGYAQAPVPSDAGGDVVAANLH